jgi:quercetin dioxygenase-like cupin family protein
LWDVNSSHRDKTGDSPVHFASAEPLLYQALDHQDGVHYNRVPTLLELYLRRKEDKTRVRGCERADDPVPGEHSCLPDIERKKMNEALSHEMPAALRVVAGTDREGLQRGLGISTIAFKLSMSDPDSSFILENTFLAKGGPARHLHYDQEEWFYVLEGEFQFEVGAERFRLQPGDSLLAPRQVPHVWAFVGEARGRILVAFFPAGKMEAFFSEVTKANAMPPQDPALWRAHGMELLGPPLPIE